VSPNSERLGELAGNLEFVRARIAAACAAAGRDPSEVTLVAVTKTYPAADVLRLTELGVPDIGENRDQEAAPKAAEVAAAGGKARWHFVGQLQRNKCRSVSRYAHLVHSVDRLPLVEVLARAAAEERDTPLGVLVQVNLDGDPARGGVHPEDVPALADEIGARPSLALRGVMAVAPLDQPAEPAFETLAAVAARVRAGFPGATAISAGMSGDMESAIGYGATHVRIGSALLGKRAPLR
jgi:pyridoxal phosphate enzyme (YggS family)